MLSNWPDPCNLGLAGSVTCESCQTQRERINRRMPYLPTFGVTLPMCSFQLWDCDGGKISTDVCFACRLKTFQSNSAFSVKSIIHNIPTGDRPLLHTASHHEAKLMCPLLSVKNLGSGNPTLQTKRKQSQRIASWADARRQEQDGWISYGGKKKVDLWDGIEGGKCPAVEGSPV